MLVPFVGEAAAVEVAMMCTTSYCGEELGVRIWVEVREISQ